MAHLIQNKNVNGVFQDMLHRIAFSHNKAETRNGGVIQLDGPVIATYDHPWQRVLFSDLRDANPFFHLMESMWMLTGRNDVDFPAHFVPRFKEYSDDGVTLAGAYGHRWRSHFEVDQVEFVIDELRHNPNSRRAVIAMWDPCADVTLVQHNGKDVPCNTTMTFQLRPNGGLEMSVFNRSNDIIWGMCGANAVHMTVLQEYIAASLGVPMGPYHQISVNAHIYLNAQGTALLNDKPCDDRYSTRHLRHVSLFGSQASREEFDTDLLRFMADPFSDAAFQTQFFDGVVAPMMTAHLAYKDGDYESALRATDYIVAWDWKIACAEWLQRRKK